MNENYIVSVCLDWLSVTFPTHYQDKLIKLLEIKEYQITKTDKSGSGFKDKWILHEHIVLMLNGQETVQGYRLAKLDLSGQACREFERRGYDWKKLFDFFLSEEINGNFTRLDIAFDIKSDLIKAPFFNVDKIISKATSGEYTCTAESYTVPKKVRKKKKKDTPEEIDEKSVYFGQIKSQMCIVIYDKKLEREYRGEDVVYRHWNRVEIRFKRDKAKHCSRLLRLRGVNPEELALYATDFLRTTLLFRVGGKEQKDSNMSRRKVCKWWNDFLDTAQNPTLDEKGNKVGLKVKGRQKSDTTIERKHKWIKHAVRKSELIMAVNSHAKTGSLKRFEEIMYKDMYDKVLQFDNHDLDICITDLQEKGYEIIDWKYVNKVFEEIYNKIPIEMFDEEEKLSTELRTEMLDEIKEVISQVDLDFLSDIVAEEELENDDHNYFDEDIFDYEFPFDD